MNSIDDFLLRIEGFETKAATEQIDFFCYYIQIVQERDGVTPKDIAECFTLTHLRPYSNIAAYLSKNSNGKAAKFIKKKTGYVLSRGKRTEIDAVLNIKRELKPTDDLFPIEIIHNTRDYIEKIANQACVCYDIGLHDASLVMVRKLLETLIIELFERNKIENKIKSKDGHYFYLSELIEVLLRETTWSLGRNAKQSLPKIKQKGDLSAHNRRFIARKKDVDNIKNELRIILEELVHLVDYPNWGK